MAHCLGYYEESPVRSGYRRTLTNVKNENLIPASKRKSSKIESMIHQTIPHLNVQNVLEVRNSFLEKMYLVTKEEYIVRGRNVEEKLLFHATSAANVDPIRKDNFNWRKVTRGKFGLGTSFSDSAEYANSKANKAIGEKRAFIVAKVLVANIVGGKQNMAVPPNKYDTTTGNNTVYVKFGDHEILPQYVVFYDNKDCQKKSRVEKHYEDDDDSYDSDSYYDQSFYDDYGQDYYDDYDYVNSYDGYY